MRRVEIRDAINTTTSLVNHELPMPIFPCYRSVQSQSPG